MDITNRTAMADALYAEYRSRGAALKAFPRGPMGLTPDSVKASQEWRDAKRACDEAFAAIRRFNQQSRGTR